MLLTRWVTLPCKMGTRRGSLGVAAGPDGIYALGGYDAAQGLRSAERLDLAASAWMPLPPMHSERVALCAVAAESHVSPRLTDLNCFRNLADHVS